MLLLLSKERFNDDMIMETFLYKEKRLKPLESVIRSFRKIVLRSLRCPSTVKPTAESESLSSISLPLHPFSVYKSYVQYTKYINRTELLV